MNKGLSTTRGGCTPVIRDSDHELSHRCRRPRGGDTTQGAPEYKLVVTNPDNGTPRPVVENTTHLPDFDADDPDDSLPEE